MPHPIAAVYTEVQSRLENILTGNGYHFDIQSVAIENWYPSFPEQNPAARIYNQVTPQQHLKTEYGQQHYSITLFVDFIYENIDKQPLRYLEMQSVVEKALFSPNNNLGNIVSEFRVESVSLTPLEVQEAITLELAMKISYDPSAISV